MKDSSGTGVEKARGEWKRWGLIILSLMMLAVVLLSIFLPEYVAGWAGEISPGCAFRRCTGISCPGCGGTRSFSALLQGDILQAFRYNFFLPFILLALFVEYLRLCAIHIFRWKNWENQRHYRLFFSVFAYSALVWFILRNVLGI
ncbi:MAG: DUF2752 domain-containing protein [Akkermansia sp.]|nr:DUF2752 domain-containing protein [Akkermansia sp.]